MSNLFFEKPVLNSPYSYPYKHWELDDDGQPTQKILPTRRSAKYITPIPRPRKKREGKEQDLVFNEGKGISTEKQQYDPTSIINELRAFVDDWRKLKNSKEWLDTCLVCKGGTYPAQLLYQEIADIACNKITAAITKTMSDETPIKAILDPYNPKSFTLYVNFNTAKKNLYDTDARKSHLNYVVLDSE